MFPYELRGHKGQSRDYESAERTPAPSRSRLREALLRLVLAGGDVVRHLADLFLPLRQVFQLRLDAVVALALLIRIRLLRRRSLLTGILLAVQLRAGVDTLLHGA